MNRRIGYSVPLTPQEFYVMAILARRSLHIYAVGQWVEHDSEGMVIMARPTARAVLIRLHIKGSIEVVPDPDNFPAHKRGPTYRLTQLGRTRLKQELRRLDRAITIGNYSLHY